MKKETKEKIMEKGKGFKVLGVILSIISLFTLIVGWVLAFMLPVRADGTNGLANILVELFRKGSKENYVFLGIWGGVSVFTTVFVIVKNIKMLKKNMRKSGNFAVCFTAGLIGLFYLTFKAFSIIFNVKSFGYNVGGLGVIISLVCYLIYQYSGVFAVKKALNIKGGKKVALIPLLSIVASLLSLGLVFFLSEKLGKVLAPKTLYDFAVNCEPYTIFFADYIEYLKMPGIHGPNVFMKLLLNVFIIVELFRTVAALLFDLAKLGCDEEYNYQSKMFNRTLPFRSAMRFAFIPFIYGIFQFTIDLYHKVGFRNSLKNISIKSAIVFVVVLAISVLISIMAMNKKKKIKEQSNGELYIGSIKKSK